jgi:NAD(P)-dependent dehydrogenase (short-subunit alcohol dehydrogenase family)
VLIVDIDAERTEQFARETDHESLSTIICDVTQPEGTQMYVQAAMDQYGKIDVFLNNAGLGGIVQPVSDYPLELFDQIMAVNVRAVWLGLKYVVPVMVAAGSGSIVITSSIMGLKGFPGVSPYITSKHAVVGMMKGVSMECSPAGVRVNTVHPAPIESTMMHAFEDGLAGGDREAGKEAIKGLIPAGRYGRPEEVARLMLFLASDDSQYCTGGQYQIDGAMGAG